MLHFAYFFYYCRGIGLGSGTVVKLSIGRTPYNPINIRGIVSLRSPTKFYAKGSEGAGEYSFHCSRKVLGLHARYNSYFYYAAPALVLNFSNWMLFPFFLKCKSSHPTNPLHWVFLPMFFTQRPIRHQNKISKRSGGGREIESPFFDRQAPFFPIKIQLFFEQTRFPEYCLQRGFLFSNRKRISGV